ncbi:rpsU-divergently transcribed protein [Peziza echinospora]|nr:rpsU-divergently transcribed protein [Peziza echinospora]
MSSILLPAIRRAALSSRSPIAASPPSLALRSARKFHSHQHAPPPSPFNPTEDAILSAALSHVPAHGFSNMALTLGARDVGYLDISVNLFPKGPFEIAYYHLVKERMALKEKVAGENGLEGGVGQKIRRLCVERLKANGPVLERWQEALAIMAYPSNIPTSISELSKLSDEMWYLAGDTSVDTSWYTKRATLAAVYSSTELFMTQDRSHGHADTWDFLDRRLRDVYRAGKITSEVAEYVGYKAQGVVDMLRSKRVIQ